MFCWLNLIKHITFNISKLNLWRCQLIVEFNLSRVYCKQTSMYHAAYGHFDLSRVSCAQTLSIDTSVIRIPFLVSVVHIIVLVTITFYYINCSSIVGVKQIPLWVHLNFSPLQETSSQGPNQTTLTKARVP